MSRNQRRNRRNKSGGSQNARSSHQDRTVDLSTEPVRHRPSTETKSALRTTELVAYVGAVLAVVMTALAVDEDGRGGDDPFGAESAIRYVTYLTIGYLVARGLAKSGSHENRVERSTDDDDAVPTAVVDDEEDLDDARDEHRPDSATADTSSGTSGQPRQGAADEVDARA